MINTNGETIYTSAEIAYELGIAPNTVNAVKRNSRSFPPPSRRRPCFGLAQKRRSHRSPATIQAWIRAGLFGETVNTGTRSHLVTEDGIRRYEEDHRGPAYDPGPPAEKRRRRKRSQELPGRI